MKYYMLPFALYFFIITTSAQAPKKAVATKSSVASKVSLKVKANPVLKVPFLKRNFLLDQSMFTGKIDTNSRGSIELAIKMLAVKSASISISNAAASSINSFTTTMDKSFRQNAVRPDKAGFTYDKNYSSQANILYNKENVDLLEYKMIYHGTKDQQELAKAMSKMPSPRNLDEKPGSTKPANEYDTDANNRVMRIYMLRYTPGEDKGFMMLYYEANLAEDLKNDGAKKLQTLVDGISTMNMQEQFDFVAMKNKELSIDIAMPEGSSPEGNGRYSLKGLTGSLAIKTVADATEGYAKELDKYYVSYGTVINKGDIIQKKLHNGLRIFSRTLTMEKKEDKYTSTWYQIVSIIVPDKKVLQKPLQVSLTLYGKNMQETTSINAYMLNSMSLPGTLTKSKLMKLKDTYAE